MPLIILTGLPCSGKTHRAAQIAVEFVSRTESVLQSNPAKKRPQVQIITSHHATLDTSEKDRPPSSLRDQVYNSAALEKTARAEEFSAINRAVSKDTVVIADGLNYIKGYRYQLWCEAKAAGTRCCVVHVAAREEECIEWNNQRLQAAGRGDEVETDKTKNGMSNTVVTMPESHTAIYGDKVVHGESRSRSSSLDGQLEGSEISRPQADDGLTLKSLYIRDNLPDSTEDAQQPVTPVLDPKQQSTHTNKANSPTYALPSTTPPPSSSAPPYRLSTLLSLNMRYEPPSPFSRWDTPLFVIPSTDPHPPYTEIWNALFPPAPTKTSKKSLAQDQTQPLEQQSEAVKQHQATILPTATSSNALQVLESATQSVTTALLQAYRAQEVGSDGGIVAFSVPILGHEGQEEAAVQAAVTLQPNTVLSQPILQRLRRKYTQIQKGAIAHGVGHVQGGRRDVVSGFVRFLGAEFEGL